MEWSASRADRLTLGERAPYAHFAAGCMEPRGGTGVMQKRKASGGSLSRFENSAEFLETDTAQVSNTAVNMATH
jgi:hypothetical protein